MGGSEQEVFAPNVCSPRRAANHGVCYHIPFFRTDGFRTSRDDKPMRKRRCTVAAEQGGACQMNDAFHLGMEMNRMSVDYAAFVRYRRTLVPHALASCS